MRRAAFGQLPLLRHPGNPGAEVLRPVRCAVCGGGARRHPDPASASQSENRPVSVVFVDLVGFTALSEGRDPEDVRELLSGYFDTARTIVGRYGGTVEKFIGDAVMAVWGVPAAREDDAERAVRAAFEIVDAVATFGAEHAVDSACVLAPALSPARWQRGPRRAKAWSPVTA